MLVCPFFLKMEATVGLLRGIGSVSLSKGSIVPMKSLRWQVMGYGAAFMIATRHRPKGSTRASAGPAVRAEDWLLCTLTIMVANLFPGGALVLR